MAIQSHKPKPKHPLPLWIRWLIVVIVLFLIICGTIIWIIQGSNAIVPVAVFGALGVLFTFFQILPLLFPKESHETTHHSFQVSPQTQVSTPLPLPSQSIQHIQTSSETAVSSSPGSVKVDWGEAPRLGSFFGRTNELVQLKQWVVDDRCHIITVLGMGGIGKTSTVMYLIDQVKDEFEYIIWCSLQNSPPLVDILRKCIQFFSNQQRTAISENIDELFSLLHSYMHTHRCMLVLDNAESILRKRSHAGTYREGYEEYGRLIQWIGTDKHQSCLLLTSREKLKEISLLENEMQHARSLQLKGLSLADGEELLESKGLHGIDENRNALIDYYDGNPLALKLISQFIAEVFNGEITEFLKSGKGVFSDIREVLDQQFARLSHLEQEIMYWLAIEREATSFNDLQEDTLHRIGFQDLQQAMWSLRRRSLVETNATGFTLQNVIMEYMTDSLIVRIIEEIKNAKPTLLKSHALMKARAKDYTRENQTRIILIPIKKQLTTILSKVDIEEKFKLILSKTRETRSQQANYVAGNILNLLVQLAWDSNGYDFSGLTIREGYLQGVSLPGINFTHADLTTSVFTDTFSSVLSVAFSPNGTLLAASMTNGEIRLWETTSYIPQLIFQGHIEWTYCVAFSPDGRILASSSEDRTVRLWNVRTGQNLKTLHGHTNRIRSIAFSPDGTILASGSDDQTICLWDIHTGEAIKILQGHINWVKCVTFSPNGGILASGSEDQNIYLWDLHTGQILRILKGHTDWIRSIVFSPDGNILASGSDDQTVCLWDVVTGQTLKTLSGHENRVNSVAFSRDGKLLASGSDDQSIRLWDIASGTVIKTLLGHTDRIWSVAFSTDDKILASGSHDQSIRLWDTSSGYIFKALEGHANPIRSVAFHPDGNILAGAYHDRSIRLWHVIKGQIIKLLQGHTGAVYTIAFSPDGETLASGGDDQTIHIWQIATGRSLKILLGHQSWISSVAFSPDNSILASSSDDHNILLWDTNTGQIIKSLQEHKNLVWSVVFSPDGKLLVSASDDQTIKLWDVTTWQVIKTLHRQPYSVIALAFSPDGTILASSYDDGFIQLWDTTSGEPIRSLQGHTDRAMSIAFHPNSRIIASGSYDRTVRLWDTDTGQLLKILNGHTQVIYEVAFQPNKENPDESILVSSGNDGLINLWNIQTGDCVNTLRSNRPYESMNITGVKGLTKAQKGALRDLGAIEIEE